jgi:hypothetical protein
MSLLAYVLPRTLMHASLSSPPRLLPVAGALLQGGEMAAGDPGSAGVDSTGADVGGFLAGSSFGISLQQLLASGLGSSASASGRVAGALPLGWLVFWGGVSGLPSAGSSKTGTARCKYCNMLACLCLFPSLVELLGLFMVALMIVGAFADSCTAQLALRQLGPRAHAVRVCFFLAVACMGDVVVAAAFGIATTADVACGIFVAAVAPKTVTFGASCSCGRGRCCW